MAAARLERWIDREALVVDADVTMIVDWNEPTNAKAWASIHKLEQKGVRFFFKD